MTSCEHSSTGCGCDALSAWRHTAHLALDVLAQLRLAALGARHAVMVTFQTVTR